MAKISVTIDGKVIEAETGKTVLDVCKTNAIEIPTLCHLDGLNDVGACRLCLVEVEGVNRLLPSCTTKIQANQVIHTQTPKLQKYRRIATELFFVERNHVCSVCIANGRCELQDMGYKVGMDHVRFPYLFQKCDVDTSHERFILDHNRCVLCTRCVRVCSDVEGAHNWGMMNRGFETRIISDFNTPWGDSTTCTSCGKCVEVCPTGAIWPKGVEQGQMEKHPEMITELIERRKMNL